MHYFREFVFVLHFEMNIVFVVWSFLFKMIESLSNAGEGLSGHIK